MHVCLHGFSAPFDGPTSPLSHLVPYFTKFYQVRHGAACGENKTDFDQSDEQYRGRRVLLHWLHCISAHYENRVWWGRSVVQEPRICDLGQSQHGYRSHLPLLRLHHLKNDQSVDIDRFCWPDLPINQLESKSRHEAHLAPPHLDSDRCNWVATLLRNHSGYISGTLFALRSGSELERPDRDFWQNL